MRSLSYYDLYCEEVEKNDQRQSNDNHLKSLYKSSENRIKYLEGHMEEMVQRKDAEALAALQKENEDLKNEIQRLKSLHNNNSNSGITTSYRIFEVGFFLNL